MELNQQSGKITADALMHHAMIRQADKELFMEFNDLLSALKNDL